MKKEVKLAIYMDSDIKMKLRILAAKEHLNMSEYINMAIYVEYDKMIAAEKDAEFEKATQEMD